MVAESGLLRGRNVKGMSYDELVAALDPTDDIGELLFDERAAKTPVFSEVKGWWLEEEIFKPYLPKEFAKRVMVEWKPETYIEGKDIDDFMEAMATVYQKVKAKHDTMKNGEEKEDLDVYFLDGFQAAFQIAKDTIAAGFKDRLVAGWA